MAEGVKRIVLKLLSQGNMQGIISLGGTQGTSLATDVMRSLPVGIPKVMVSTVAAGDTTNIEQAKRVNGAKGPVEWFIPGKGFCSYSTEGEMFYNPNADKVYVETLKRALRKDIPVHIVEKDINDPSFASAAAERLIELMRN